MCAFCTINYALKLYDLITWYMPTSVTPSPLSWKWASPLFPEPPHAPLSPLPPASLNLCSMLLIVFPCYSVSVCGLCSDGHSFLVLAICVCSFSLSVFLELSEFYWSFSRTNIDFLLFSFPVFSFDDLFCDMCFLPSPCVRFIWVLF